MEDEDIGSRLPLAICLEDSIFSVNIHRIMLSELTTRNDRSVYCAYNPVSKTLPENYTSLRSKEKKRLGCWEGLGAGGEGDNRG